MKQKSKEYKEEQYKILNKIINILNINDNNNYLILYELDNNIELQNKILELVPDIKKYFSVYGVKALIYPEEVKRVYLCIIKYIIKLEYKIIISDCNIKNETNDIIRTKKYYFIKNN